MVLHWCFAIAVCPISPRRVVVVVLLYEFLGPYYFFSVILYYADQPCPVAPQVVVLRGFLQYFIHQGVLFLMVLGVVVDEVAVVPDLEIFEIVE